MLFRTALLCLFSANLVAAQFFLPEAFAAYNARTILKPYKDGSKKGDSSIRVIRGLLVVRQSECPTGTAECATVPGELVVRLAFSPLPRRISHALWSWSSVFRFTPMSVFDCMHA